ncbi:MAG TPA: SH3 domain-containing protein [Streptosporangiaceae bacterium]|nr:SH3 domain-containing protein [Streptosporangiaceae bacterium]
MRRMTMLAASAVATLGLATAAPASASTGASHIANWGCGSVPTFVSSKDGGFTGSGINIRSGPSTSCTVYGLGYEGQILKVWCQVSSGGASWVYLNDRTTGIRGWSLEHYVSFSGGLPTCT